MAKRLKVAGGAMLERLKKTAMVWLSVYPSVLLVISLVGDVFEDWPLPLRVLGATVIIVPIIANITGPAVEAAVTAIVLVWRQRRSRSAL
jgi:antibiotic biosynthesis monooxygenase (ABM) superfamily enzyme